MVGIDRKAATRYFRRAPLDDIASPKLVDIRLAADAPPPDPSEELNDLKRFYSSYGEAHAVETGHDGLQSFVAVAREAIEAPTDIFKALNNLHPAVREFVVAIIDGADVQAAAREARLNEASLSKILPPLRIFLRPYLQ